MKIDKVLCCAFPRSTLTITIIIERKLIKRHAKTQLTHRMHRSRVAQPGVVHLLDISCTRSVQKGLGGCRVVRFDARCSQEVVCELKSINKAFIDTVCRCSKSRKIVDSDPDKSWWTNSCKTIKPIHNKSRKHILSYLAFVVIFSRCDVCSPETFVGAPTTSRSFAVHSARAYWRRF